MTPPPATDDPTALAQFGQLDVIARQLVEGFMLGQHKSPFKGTSIEFVEHRQYYPGDEVRHIDWRAYGKTGKYYIKEFEDETNLYCYLLVDASGSMAYHGATLSKFQYVRQLAAALGYLLLSQRDAIGAAIFDTRLRQRLEPSARPANFRWLLDALEQCQPGRETSLATVLQEIRPVLKRRSLVVNLSDFFDDMAVLRTALHSYRHARHELLLLQVVTPEEEEFPFSKPTQFRSLERQGHRLLVDPHRLRRHYLERYREFCDELQRLAGTIGADYQKLVTTQPYAQALGAYLAKRTKHSSPRGR